MAKAAGKPAGWGLLIGVGALLLVQDLACKLGGAAKPTVSDALRATLEDAAPQAISPALNAAHAEADALAAALSAWSAAEAAGDGGAAQLEAQAAYRSALAAWQQVEALQVGPIAQALNSVGGADLRDEIYSYPLTNPCRVDQETVYGGFEAEGGLDAAPLSARGLDAIEVLLFSAVGENACPAQVDINADGSWAALGDAGVQARRAAYAAALGGEVLGQIGVLDASFTDGGDWALALSGAAVGTGPYDSPDSALNALYDAAFYVESVTKDDKLGAILGQGGCTADCGSLVEARASGASHLAVQANLKGFRALWTMSDGSGFSVLLRSLGQGDLADDVEAALVAAEAAAAALDVPLDVALASDPAAVEALYDALITLGALWKTDVATALVMSIPDDAAGDND